MEKTQTVTMENLNEVIKTLEWKPRGSELVITTNLMETEDELDLSGGMISPEQIVISVGEHIRDIKDGDKVFLDLNKLVRITQNSRDFDNPVQEMDIFPLMAGEFRLGIIDGKAVKLIKK